MVGRGDENGVNVLAGDDFAEVVADGAVGVFVEFVHRFFAVVAADGVNVANGEHARFQGEEIGEQVARLPAHADERHGEEFAGGGFRRPNAGWKDEGRGRGQGGGGS